MAKSSQTFRKRQRELKVREKAQLKRERREQRRNEKKALLATASPETTGLEPSLAEMEPAESAAPEA